MCSLKAQPVAPTEIELPRAQHIFNVYNEICEFSNSDVLSAAKTP
jgi:hypothetical protein